MSTSARTHDPAFARELLQGLRDTPKHISSRYFYDDRGSLLFQQIMRMESYYLTDAEFEIFLDQGEALVDAFSSDGSPFRLVEFGAGDGLKTKLLIEKLLEHQVPVTYTPIDISAAAIRGLVADFGEQFPDLMLEPLVDEYFGALDQLIANGDTQRKVVLFLGSNIGNFRKAPAITFLEALRDHLTEGDKVLIGFDLKKDPRVVLPAYSDPEGITREFNLNLLDRINREFDADFDREQFDHYASYDPLSGETRSYILSKRKQTVRIQALDLTVHFNAWEPIWTELSQKYDQSMIHELASESGFQYVEGFFDSRRYFVDALWEWQ